MLKWMKTSLEQIIQLNIGSSLNCSLQSSSKGQHWFFQCYYRRLNQLYLYIRYLSCRLSLAISHAWLLHWKTTSLTWVFPHNSSSLYVACCSCWEATVEKTWSSPLKETRREERGLCPSSVVGRSPVSTSAISPFRYTWNRRRLRLASTR